MTSRVYQVDYTRADGVATAPIVALTVEGAAALVQALLRPDVSWVESVRVTPRPPMPGEGY